MSVRVEVPERAGAGAASESRRAPLVAGAGGALFALVLFRVWAFAARMGQACAAMGLKTVALHGR